MKGCFKDVIKKEGRDQGISEEAVESNGVCVFKLTPLCIQDPFELTHNVAQNLSLTALKRIIQMMMDAHRTVKRFLHPEENPPKFKGILNLFTCPPQAFKKKMDDVCSFFIKFDQSRCGSPGIKLETNSIQNEPMSITSVKNTFDAAIRVLRDKLGISCDLTRNQTNFAEMEKLCGATDNKACCEEIITPSHNTNPLHNSNSFDSPADSNMSENEWKQTGKRKRNMLEAVSSDENPNRTGKKAKFSPGKQDGDQLTIVCTAWNNTWSNRRRERRKRQQSELAGNGTENSHYAKGVCKTGSCKTEPILTVSLTVSAESTRGCWVSFQMLGDTEREIFLNFYSFFKKCFQELVGFSSFSSP